MLITVHELTIASSCCALALAASTAPACIYRSCHAKSLLPSLTRVVSFFWEYVMCC